MAYRFIGTSHLGGKATQMNSLIDHFIIHKTNIKCATYPLIEQLLICITMNVTNRRSGNKILIRNIVPQNLLKKGVALTKSPKSPKDLIDSPYYQRFTSIYISHRRSGQARFYHLSSSCHRVLSSNRTLVSQQTRRLLRDFLVTCRPSAPSQRNPRGQAASHGSDHPYCKTRKEINFNFPPLTELLSFTRRM